MANPANDQRINATAAINSPKNNGTSTGGTSHSLILKVLVSGNVTAFGWGGSGNALSHR